MEYALDVTTLGLIFLILFGLTALKGRKSLLLGLATAIPFNSSSAFISGSVSISPFYLGLVLFIAWTVLERTANKETSLRRTPSKAVLIGFFVYVVSVTIFGPVLFRGIGVVASGIGMDEQVRNLSALSPSSSNLAQVLYLALCLAFIYVNERDQIVGMRFLLVAFSVGTIVAILGLVCARLGLTWPGELFDNSPRGFYSTEMTRLRAQFAEPSQLGAFALTATVFFTSMTFQSRNAFSFAFRLAFAAMAAALVAASSSGSAVVGGLVAVAAFAILGVVRATRPGALLAPSAVVASCAITIVMAYLLPKMAPFVTTIIADKQGGQSFTNRGLSNEIALDLFKQTFLIGVGLGSNRASSLLMMLLSTIGLVGTGLFLWIVARSIANSIQIPARLPAVLALIALVATSFVSLADFVSPLLWSLICVCLAPGPTAVQNKIQDKRNQKRDSEPAGALSASRGSDAGASPR